MRITLYEDQQASYELNAILRSSDWSASGQMALSNVQFSVYRNSRSKEYAIVGSYRMLDKIRTVLFLTPDMSRPEINASVQSAIRLYFGRLI